MIQTQFVITAEEAATIEKWTTKHGKKCKLPPTTIGDRYTYCFTPTGIGVLVSVECVCGKKKYFTNYDEL